MRYGNLFQLESRQLFVDEACSGIVSIMSVIACAALYAVWQRRTLLHTLLLVITGIGWAAAMNVVRIFVVSAAHAWYDTNLAEGTPHEILGVVVFLGTTLAVISTDQVLAILLAPIRVSAIWQAEAQQNAWINGWNQRIAHSDESAQPPGSPPPNQQRTAPFPRPFALATALACVLLGMYQLAGPSLANQFADREVQNVLKMTADALPAQIGDWKRIEFETVHREVNAELGEYSHVFHYQHVGTSQRVVMSIDFPFRRGWHELCACYRASGWTLVDRGVIEDDSTSGSAPWNYVQAQFERKDQTTPALLLYTFADGQGQRISPPSQDLYERITERIRRRGPYSIAPRYYQIQLWVPQLAGKTSDAQDTYHQLFKICREHCREFVELSN
jgi:exosortase/archaeosortase family protein